MFFAKDGFEAIVALLVGVFLFGLGVKAVRQDINLLPGLKRKVSLAIGYLILGMGVAVGLFGRSALVVMFAAFLLGLAVIIIFGRTQVQRVASDLLEGGWKILWSKETTERSK